MNIVKKIKDWLATKTLVHDSGGASITKVPTEAIDERAQEARKRARKNFAQQELQIMDRFTSGHDINCTYPITPCDKVPCFVHEPDKIVKKIKVKKVGRKFVEIE